MRKTSQNDTSLDEQKTKTIKISFSLHHDLKVIASEQGISLQELVEQKLYGTTKPSKLSAKKTNYPTKKYIHYCKRQMISIKTSLKKTKQQLK